MMLRELCDPLKFEAVRRRLIFISGYKYRIRSSDVEDIVQNALTAYCESRDRYAEETNQMGILVGILQKKCLEFIDHSSKTSRRLKRIAQEGVTTEESPFKPERGGTTRPVVDQVIRKEDGDHIVDALESLKPESREMFELLLEEGVGRRGLIERYNVKANTLDSRLRTARMEFREVLKARGIIV
jgi:RNA polymerase sigma factor (sigma-70 family)